MVFRYVFNLWIGLGLAGLAVCALPPQAQAQGVSIIRDAETEQLQNPERDYRCAGA